MADRLAELVEVRLASAGVALVTLNLPRLRNAMTTELTSAWTVAMDEVTGDRSLRAVVVTGAGSAFCSGADLSWLDQGDPGDNTPDRLRDKMLPFYRTWLAPQQIPVPVALQWEALAQPVTMATADIHEGIQARREHRPPAFEGS
jgi:enoyl-CoA hydratase